MDPRRSPTTYGAYLLPLDVIRRHPHPQPFGRTHLHAVSTYRRRGGGWFTPVTQQQKRLDAEDKFMQQQIAQAQQARAEMVRPPSWGERFNNFFHREEVINFVGLSPYVVLPVLTFLSYRLYFRKYSTMLRLLGPKTVFSVTGALLGSFAYSMYGKRGSDKSTPQLRAKERDLKRYRAWRAGDFAKQRAMSDEGELDNFIINKQLGRTVIQSAHQNRIEAGASGGEVSGESLTHTDAAETVDNQGDGDSMMQGVMLPAETQQERRRKRRRKKRKKRTKKVGNRYQHPQQPENFLQRVSRLTREQQEEEKSRGLVRTDDMEPGYLGFKAASIENAHRLEKMSRKGAMLLKGRPLTERDNPLTRYRKASPYNPFGPNYIKKQTQKDAGNESGGSVGGEAEGNYNAA